MDLTEKEAHRIAVAVVDEVFSRLGVDTSTSEGRERWLSNFRYLDAFHEGAKLTKKTIIKTSVGAFVTGTLALIVWGFKDWIAQALVVIPLPR